AGARRTPAWNPQEEQALRELFWKYKEAEGQDVIASILAELPGRTRRQVVQQLVRMGLADSARDFPRPRKGTNIVLWTEEQELELERLFEEFRGSDGEWGLRGGVQGRVQLRADLPLTDLSPDVLGNIMKNLTARRSRARVVEKLLALGLVADRKELHKKRRRKSCGPQKGEADAAAVPAQNSSAENSEEEEEEEEEEEDEADDDPMEEPWDPKEGTGLALVQRLQQEGLDGPLRWLQNCLKRTARDRETEGMSFPVPLVPLSEENEDAMENRGFRALLREVGLRPPANEQESFWRIPAALTPQQLRRAATSITPSSPEELPPQELPVAPKNLAGGESVGWGQGARWGCRNPPLEPLFLCPTAEPVPSLLGSDSESEEPLSIPAPSGSKRRRRLDSEEEEDGDLEAELPLPDPPSEEDEDPHPTGRRKRVRRLLEEEEEEEED
ncbi:UNVERIFIED_CONTAM: hypothetical protein H355_008446, partial [Colinus virginianus]